MLFDNPIFKGWYTDTVDIYRVVPDKEGNLTKQKRQKQNTAPSRAGYTVLSETVLLWDDSRKGTVHGKDGV